MKEGKEGGSEEVVVGVQVLQCRLPPSAAAALRGGRPFNKFLHWVTFSLFRDHLSNSFDVEYAHLWLLGLVIFPDDDDSNIDSGLRSI